MMPARETAGVTRSVDPRRPTGADPVGGPHLDRRRTGPTVQSVPWVVIAALVGWPVYDIVPHPGLDRSWQLALSLTHERGAGFGDDVVFNYGPLGFVAQPMIGVGPIFFAAMLGMAAVVLLSVVCFRTALGASGLSCRWVGPATVLTMLVAPAENLAVEVATLALCTVLARRAWHRHEIAAIQWFGIGVVAVALVLIKVSVAPALTVGVGLATVAQGRRALAGAAAGSVGGFVVLWFVSGQDGRSIPSWFSGAAEVAAGHTSAMNLEPPGLLWEYAMLTVIAVTSVALALGSTSLTDPRGSKLAAAAIVVFVGWFMFRQGLTRHGPRSRLTFFTVLWFTAILVPWARLSLSRRAVGAAVVGTAFVSMMLVTPNRFVEDMNPLRRLGYVATGVDMVASGSARRERTDRAVASSRDEYAIPATMLNAIGTEPVHVDPTEVAAAWAYGLNWRPMPTLQRYISYTQDLDDRNAQFLRADDAPQFVLRQSGQVIDGRYELVESPAYSLELLCRYRSVIADVKWELLERSTNRCGAAEELLTVRLRQGERIDLPTVEESDALLMSVGFDTSLVNRFAALVLKPIDNPHYIIDGERYRAISRTSAVPGLLQLPERLTDSRLDEHNPPTSTLGVDTAATVTIFSMPILDPGR